MRGFAATCLFLGLAGAFLTAGLSAARADDWHRDWRHDWHPGWHDHDYWRWGVRPYYVPPPVYVPPPPAYYPPPPVYYPPPPVYYGAPAATFGFGIR